MVDIVGIVGIVGIIGITLVRQLRMWLTARLVASEIACLTKREPGFLAMVADAKSTAHLRGIPHDSMNGGFRASSPFWLDILQCALVS